MSHANSDAISGAGSDTFAHSSSDLSVGAFPSPTLDVDQIIHDLAEFGVAVMPPFLSSQTLKDARAAAYAAPSEDARLGRQADEFPLDYGQGNVRVWNLLARHAAYVQFIQSPQIVSIVRRVLGWPALLGNFSANIAQPGSEGGALHADQLFVPSPWPAEPQGMNAAWLLDDFTADNGATEFVIGSHQSHTLEDPPSQMSAIPLQAEAGSVALFESRVWHRTGSNQSGQDRAAAFAWFTKPIYRTQENWFLTLDEDDLSIASDDMLTLLGYHAKGLGLVYGRSPRQPNPADSRD